MRIDLPPMARRALLSGMETWSTDYCCVLAVFVDLRWTVLSNHLKRRSVRVDDNTIRDFHVFLILPPPSTGL
jgi:hypothetical protein